MAPPLNEWRMKMADGMNTGNSMNQGRGLTIREEGLNLRKTTIVFGYEKPDYHKLGDTFVNWEGKEGLARMTLKEVRPAGFDQGTPTTPFDTLTNRNHKVDPVAKAKKMFRPRGFPKVSLDDITKNADAKSTSKQYTSFTELKNDARRYCRVLGGDPDNRYVNPQTESQDAAWSAWHNAQHHSARHSTEYRPRRGCRETAFAESIILGPRQSAGGSAQTGMY